MGTREKGEWDMEAEGKTVDGLCFIPPALREFIRGEIPETPFRGKIPWTSLKRRIEEATLQ
jgi:hypothetical protein